MMYAAHRDGRSAYRPVLATLEGGGLAWVEEHFGLGGRIALVTGSRQGIGRTIARGLGSAGAVIVINARDEQALETAAQELRLEGLQVHTAAFDVTDHDATRRAIHRIELDVGPIDILVNNAGIQIRRPLEEFSEADWDRIIATNLTSVFHVGQAVARWMIPRGRGKIINICSAQSELARKGIAPYTASKGAVKNLTKGMCADWAGHGIQVNGLGPGYYVTPLTQSLKDDPVFDQWLRNRVPAGRWADPEELVGAAVFLASPASDFVNGQVLYVDGGLLAVV